MFGCFDSIDITPSQLANCDKNRASPQIVRMTSLIVLIFLPRRARPPPQLADSTCQDVSFSFAGDFISHCYMQSKTMLRVRGG